MCRVKAMASSVERLLLYVNYRGSREGRTEADVSFDQLLKTLAEDGYLKKVIGYITSYLSQILTELHCYKIN